MKEKTSDKIECEFELLHWFGKIKGVSISLNHLREGVKASSKSNDKGAVFESYTAKNGHYIFTSYEEKKGLPAPIETIAMFFDGLYDLEKVDFPEIKFNTFKKHQIKFLTKKIEQLPEYEDVLEAMIGFIKDYKSLNSEHNANVNLKADDANEPSLNKTDLVAVFYYALEDRSFQKEQSQKLKIQAFIERKKINTTLNSFRKKLQNFKNRINKTEEKRYTRAQIQNTIKKIQKIIPYLKDYKNVTEKAENDILFLQELLDQPNENHS